jgi:hypothetical protein
MYDELDERIIKAIANGKRPSSSIPVQREANRIARAMGRPDFRVIEGRVQHLRKQGRIRFLTKAQAGARRGWCVVEGEDNK